MKLDNSKLLFKVSLSTLMKLISENYSTNAEMFLMLKLSLDPMENQKDLPLLNSLRSHLSTKPLSSTEPSTWAGKFELNKLEETTRDNNKEEETLEVSLTKHLETLWLKHPPSSSVDYPLTQPTSQLKNSSPQLVKSNQQESSPTKKPKR